MAASAVWLGNCSSFCFRKPKLHSVKTKVAGASELGFLSSEFAGTRISLPSSLLFPKPLVAPSMPTTNLMPIVARRVCPFTGKKTNRANKVSFSNHKTKKLQFVNLQYKRIWWEAGNRWLKLRLSTNAIKTIEKNGLEAVAKKAGIELKKIR